MLAKPHYIFWAIDLTAEFAGFWPGAGKQAKKKRFEALCGEEKTGKEETNAEAL